MYPWKRKRKDNLAAKPLNRDLEDGASLGTSPQISCVSFVSGTRQRGRKGQSLQSRRVVRAGSSSYRLQVVGVVWNKSLPFFHL